MKVEWYAVDQWNCLYGPYKTRGDAEDRIYKNYTHELPRESYEEYHKNWTVFPQLSGKDNK